MSDLEIHHRPILRNPPMVLGFTGWMDGGNVSTGTVGYLRKSLGAIRFADIRPHDFYLLHFPVSTLPISVYAESGGTILASMNPMEFTAIFRPHAHIEDGRIKELIFPENEFWCSEDPPMILFSGEEPHIRWGAYAECMFTVAEQFGVTDIYFCGSVAGPIPHTREPRLRGSVSHATLKDEVRAVGAEFSNYEGPGSLVTFLTQQSAERGIRMRSFVVEVPHYPFLSLSRYPRSIIRTVSALNQLLGLDLDLSDLHESTEKTDAKLDDLRQENEDFAKLVTKLEKVYDQEESEEEDEEILRRLIDGLGLEGDED